VATGIGRVEIL